MNEKGVPYQGIVIRIEGGRLTTLANVNTQVTNNPKLNFNEGMQVVLKRERDIYSYSIDGGITFIQAAD